MTEDEQRQITTEVLQETQGGADTPWLPEIEGPADGEVFQ